jgi:hypothetical protein
MCGSFSNSPGEEGKNLLTIGLLSSDEESWHWLLWSAYANLRILFSGCGYADRIFT